MGRIPQSLFDVSLVLRQRIQAGVRSIRNSSLCFVCRFGSKRLSPRREIVWFFYGIFQSQLLKRQRLEFNVRLRRTRQSSCTNPDRKYEYQEPNVLMSKKP